MSMGSAAGAQRPGLFSKIRFDDGFHRVRGKVVQVMHAAADSGFAVFSVGDLSSGRRMQIVGRFERPEVGKMVHLEQLRYGYDPDRQRFAFYITRETMRLDAAAVIDQALRDAPPARPVRFAPLAVERLPLDRTALRKYLVENFTGIGDASAEQMVASYGHGGEPALLDALDSAGVDDFVNVTRLGPSVARAVLTQWRESPRAHRAMVALRSMGLTKRQSQAALERAMKSMMAKVDAGDQPFAPDPLRAAFRICQHPYRLTLLDGIGFATADAAARRLGLPHDSDQRIAAAAREALALASRDGDTMLPLYDLAERTAELLDEGAASGRRRRGSPATPSIDPVRIAKVIWAIDPSEGVVFPLGRTGAHDPVSTERLVLAEESIARSVCRMLATPIHHPIAPPTDDALTEAAGRALHERQALAVRRALASNVVVITGGPGTGKTSILRALLGIYEQEGLRVVQAAPTGAAARRQNDATGRPAATAHRVLGSRGFQGGFEHDEGNPIDADVLVLDEGSMSDALVAAPLLRALKPTARAVIVGDHDQLPSVGPGAVLADLIASGVPPVARLTKTFRQDSGNPISDLARNIRDGIAQLPADADPRHLEVIRCKDKEATARQIIETVLRLRDAGVAPEDMVVLTPMVKGVNGVNALNAQIQRLINPEGRRGLRIGGDRFRDAASAGDAAESSDQEMTAGPGDRVMQRKNDRELELANGDVGTVLRFGRDRRSLIVDFGVGEVEISGYKLGSLQLAYACTIHKSQGSEYKHVIMALSPEHKIMMRRNLLYTGVTRAKEHLVVVGDPEVLQNGVHQVQDSQRKTLLQSFLRREAALLREKFIPDEDTIKHEPLPDFSLDFLQPH